MIKTMNIEDAATEVLAYQLDIARQSIEDRDRRIWELQKKVELLEGMLNRAAALGGRLPQPQPLPGFRTRGCRRCSVAVAGRRLIGAVSILSREIKTSPGT